MSFFLLFFSYIFEVDFYFNNERSVIIGTVIFWNLRIRLIVVFWMGYVISFVARTYLATYLSSFRYPYNRCYVIKEKYLYFEKEKIRMFVRSFPFLECVEYDIEFFTTLNVLLHLYLPYYATSPLSKTDPILVPPASFQGSRKGMKWKEKTRGKIGEKLKKARTHLSRKVVRINSN